MCFLQRVESLSSGKNFRSWRLWGKHWFLHLLLFWMVGGILGIPDDRWVGVSWGYAVAHRRGNRANRGPISCLQAGRPLSDPELLYNWAGEELSCRHLCWHSLLPTGFLRGRSFQNSQHRMPASGSASRNLTQASSF